MAEKKEKQRRTTRAAQGGGTIRKRPDGRWEARFTTGRDPGTGKQVQKSVYGATQAEVRKKLQQATADIDTGVYAEPIKMTLGAWLDIWLAEFTGGVKPYTIESYSLQVKNHIKPALGAVQLTALTTPMIQKFYNSLHKPKDGKRPLSAKSIKNVHGVLHKALQQAVEIGSIRVNPSTACKLPRIVKPDLKPLGDDELDNFLKAIKGHQFETLFIVDLFTGMRQGEILGLQWDSVDFQKGTIYVHQQLQRHNGVYQFAPLKNDKARLIAPAPKVMKVLQEHKRKQAQWRLLAGELWEAGTLGGLVFTNELGKHFARSTVYTHFKNVVRGIGSTETRFHDLRHSYAVAALRAGDDIKTVQENLGHHTAAFTLDTYGFVTEAMKKESAARMEKFMEGFKNL